MARRSEHTQDEIRSMVLNAAETILIEDGLAKLKVRNIAMEIGYTVGSIYMVFDNMADLILHLKARTLDDMALHLQQVPSNNTAQCCLLDLSKAYLNFANQHFNRWNMLFDHTKTPESVTPDWYKHKITQLFRPIEYQFERLAPNASAEQTQRAAQALWSGVHGICCLSLSGSLDVVGVRDVEATVVVLVNSFVRGWASDLP
ncbi:MAG: TetR/AcrR family transcriptional regulator [Methylococcaceae bacterium]